jgi:hypothetical protein
MTMIASVQPRKVLCMGTRGVCATRKGKAAASEPEMNRVGKRRRPSEKGDYVSVTRGHRRVPVCHCTGMTWQVPFFGSRMVPGGQDAGGCLGVTVVAPRGRLRQCWPWHGGGDRSGFTIWPVAPPDDRIATQAPPAQRRVRSLLPRNGLSAEAILNPTLPNSASAYTAPPGRRAPPARRRCGPQHRPPRLRGRWCLSAETMAWDCLARRE